MKLRKQKCELATSILKQFAHPKRLLILCSLSENKKTVSELSRENGISQSQTSQFLIRMRKEGLLEVDKIKNESFYYIKQKETKRIILLLKKIFT